jgi:hypothetical protein
VFGGLNRPLAAAAVAAAFLVVPSLAFACNSGTSAVNVYTECLPSGGGGKPAGSHHKKSSAPTQTGTSEPSPAPAPAPIPTQTKKALKKAGSDGESLSHLVNRMGAVRLLQSHSAAAAEPTAVGSAFDLGSGPTVLLIILAGTAVLLLGFSGFRGLRRR